MDDKTVKAQEISASVGVKELQSASNETGKLFVPTDPERANRGAGAGVRKRFKVVNNIQFRINGKNYSVNPAVDNLSPNSVLVDFIRDRAFLKGTKYMCREGGCGACVVTVKTTDEKSKKETTRAVNSCLAPLFGCDGWDISTVESLGNEKDGLHPIQQRLVKFNGTQCGFCTPGMVMNMHSLTQLKKELTTKDVEENFDGNICRCTGYRPIMDAFKSFAVDAPVELRRKCSDIEDCSDWIVVDNLPTSLPVIPKTQKSYFFTKFGEIWVKAVDLNMFFAHVQKLRSKGRQYRLVAGDTAKGVYKNDPKYSIYVDISSIPELTQTSMDATGSLVIGAGMTLKETIDYLQESSKISGYEYCAGMSAHLMRIANTPIRNVGTLAGNLMMKHTHNEFSSDVFIAFETVGAKINIASLATTSGYKTNGYYVQEFFLPEFLKMDMNSKLIISLNLPALRDGYVFRSFKISRRYQNAHAYVNAGFLMKIDPKQNFKVLEKPMIVYGGIDPNFIHATKTETFLEGKQLNDVNTLLGALEILNSEIQPNYIPPNAVPEYRKFLTQSLLYKTILGILGKNVNGVVRSGGADIKRGPMSGKQTFGRDNSSVSLYQAISKLEAPAQTTGEAGYVDDLPIAHGELFGAFVFTTVAKATLKIVDASAALAMPGVVAFITAKDIPGENNAIMRLAFPPYVEPHLIFVEDEVTCAGQAVGMIFAESKDVAYSAAKKVQVVYEDVETPDLDIRDLLAKYEEDESIGEHYFDTFSSRDIGETPTHTIEGEFRIGSQYHFHMETQSCVCIPKEDGLDIYSASQFMDHVQGTVAAALNVPNNTINIKVSRVGGGFGAKLRRSGLIASAAALGTYVTGRPVRVILDLETNMHMIGKRMPFLTRYKVGTDNNGKIVSLRTEIFCDTGNYRNEAWSTIAQLYFQNVYKAIGWDVTSGWVKTNTPANTAFRAPGSIQGISTMEYIMDHIAHTLQKDPLEVREINLISDGDQLLDREYKKFEGKNLIPQMIEELKTTSNYDSRKKLVEAFNKVNRWRKRGLSLTNFRFQPKPLISMFPALVAIYHQDGTVAVSHCGIEQGQGINTKVAQTVAYELNIPLEKVKIKPADNLISANGQLSGGSITSEMCCNAASRACKILLERMAPIRERNPDATWEKLVEESFNAFVDLTATYRNDFQVPVINYHIWGVCLTEVEVDILTGESKIVRVDLIEDAGKSLNPDVDIGQIEGSFVMGIGLWTTEKIEFDKNTGQLLTKNTWEYKPPEPRDIPEDFRVTLLRKASNEFGVLRSKATGEPPICLSVSVLLALKNAIQSARIDAGNSDWFQLDGPVQPEDIVRLSLTSPEQFGY